LRWGPFVLAYDASQNPGLPAATAVSLAELSKPSFTLRAGDKLAFAGKVASRRGQESRLATFTTFADAGADGGTYCVWLRAPGAELGKDDSLLADAEETRSRPGNLAGSINDGDFGSVVVTFDGQAAREDWFAVTLPAAVSVRRVVFAHGKSFHDGGWFDTSADRPKVQIRRTPTGAWETAGELADYPATTSTDDGKLKAGQKFTLRLDTPLPVVAVRVIGKPASGDYSRQAFSSCAELQAFAE
jgi:uncharacterized protein